MIKAVIFDADGVIFDSEEIHYEVEAKALREVGIPVTSAITKEYSGMRLDEEFLAIAKRFNKKIYLPEAIKVRDRILTSETKNGFPLAPYAEYSIKNLSKDYLLAVSTSGEKRFIGKQLKSSGLSKYFRVSIFGEDIENPKPSPDSFLIAAEKLNIRPSECVVIEDSLKGFKATKAANMTLIARKAPHNRHIDFSLADFAVEDLRDILGILRKLNS
jgi:HAD superfamily hydrolase (TIGR01509 family)